jgi:MATE family multidrug resistance protein
MVSQNVLNLVDTAMVGTLGAAALAAVGMASFANFMSQAFITGLSTGVQAMAARRLGEGKTDETAVPLNGGLGMAVLLALPWCALLYLLADTLFPYLNSDPAVIAEGVPYFRARLLGMAAVGMNFAFRGYWNGINLSRLYLQTLLIMHACNIGLNYVLIFGELGFPALGAEGAGLGTTISTWIGTAVYFSLGLRHAREGGFLRGLPGVDTLRTMLKLSVPAGLQQFFFAAGFTTLFWIIGRVGTVELAAANVLINVTLVAILPGLGLGLAAASLVGQALGRGDPADAKAWGWDTVVVGMGLMGLLGLPMLLTPELVLGIFLDGAPLALAAALPLQIVGGTILVDAVGMVLLNALLGAGASRTVMAVSIGTQWLLFLPAAYLVGPVLGGGLLAIWIAQVAYRSLQAVIFGAIWQAGRWAAIKV